MSAEQGKAGNPDALDAVWSLSYDTLFNAIAAATKPHQKGVAIAISVLAFRLEIANRLALAAPPQHKDATPPRAWTWLYATAVIDGQPSVWRAAVSLDAPPLPSPMVRDITPLGAIDSAETTNG